MTNRANENAAERSSKELLEVSINKQRYLLKATAYKHRVRLGVALVCGIALVYGFISPLSQGIATDYQDILISGLLVLTTIWGIIEFSNQSRAKNILSECDQTSIQVEHCLTTSVIDEAKLLESKLCSMSQKERGTLLSLYSQSKLPIVTQHITKLEAQKYKQDLEQAFEKAKLNLILEYWQKLTSHPLNQVKTKLDSTFTKLSKRRKELQAQWDATYETLSWWNKIKHADGPDFSELDGNISKVKELTKNFDIKHGAELVKLEAAYKALHDKALNRCQRAFDASVVYVNDKYAGSNSTPNVSTDHLLLAAGWAGVFGLSYSLWDDFMTTHDVYDALRGVNGNFEGMSDSEVWLETMWMTPESLSGLASLTKGAYFEQLVATDTKGELFKHFNHPDTDITIDGIAYQLKATDSVDYIDSVAADIPVIATSEVAESANAIDSGFTNVELTADVDMAIDGIGIDPGDIMTDGILAGLGGLGFFATLNGINHASERYNQGSDGEQAIFEGLGVAIEGTAKTMVDAGEMVYKAATSRPSRAVGRGILKILERVDQKLEEAARNGK